MDDVDVEAAVEERRLWLDDQLQSAATRFDLTPSGDVVNTYDMRSAGSLARTTGDDPVWLRVVLEDPDYQPQCRWEGNVEANAITGVPKPVVLRWADWDAGAYEPDRQVRGEVQSLAPGRAISEDSLVDEDPALPAQWWSDLVTALTNLARHPIPQREHDVDTVGATIQGVHAHFHVDFDPHLFDEVTWTTAHADLHWGNLHCPELYLVDWESWRAAPAGYDAATLYCTSLLHPPTAARVRELFAPILDTHSGRVALLAAVCRYLALDTDDAMERELHAIGTQLLDRLLSREVR
jgi:hypothetical protein